MKTEKPTVVDQIKASKRAQKLLRQFLWIKEEVKAQLYLAIPIALSCVLLEVPFYTSIAFVGHIEGHNVTTSTFVEAMALNISFIHLIVTSVIYGLVTAIETLVSQSVGAGNFPRVGVILQRSILIIFLVMLLQYAILSNSTSILHLLHQPPCVIDQIELFMQVFYAGIPPFVLQYLFMRYYQAQGVVLPFILTGVVANVVNIVAHFVFVVVLQLEMRGAALSLCVCYYSQLLSIVIVALVLKLNKSTWEGWSRECLNGWGEFLKFGIPGIIMVATDWSIFQVGYFLLGFMPGNEIELAIFGIITNYELLMFILGPFTFGLAMSVQIGIKLGAGKPNEAKKSMFTSFVMFGIWMSFLEIITSSLREYIPRISTSDECILKPLHLPWLLLLVEVFFGHTEYFLGCVLRGCGLQILGSITGLSSYGFISVIIGAIFVVMLDMGTVGFMIGLTIGGVVAFVFNTFIIICIDWEKRSQKAQNMAKLKSTNKHATEDDGDKPKKEGNDSLDAPDINKKDQKKDKNRISAGDLAVKIAAVVIIISVTATAICIGNLFVYRRELCMIDYQTSANDTTVITKHGC